MPGPADPAGHYEALGVSPSATAAEVRAAYLQLARRHHPDRLSDRPAGERRDSASIMSRINEAWSVLGDEARRAEYDAASGGRSSATIRDVDHEFVEFDDDEDWIDPRLLDDTPSGPGLSRPLTFLPVGFGVAAVVLIFGGWFFGFDGLAQAGVVALVAAFLAFVLIPLVAMINSSRADRLP